MTVNEASTPVNTAELEVLLPAATVNVLVEPLESLLDMQVGIFYPDGTYYYGLELCRQAEAPIVVEHDEIGFVGVCGSQDDSQLHEAAAYLANTLFVSGAGSAASAGGRGRGAGSVRRTQPDL